MKNRTWKFEDYTYKKYLENWEGGAVCRELKWQGQKIYFPNKYQMLKLLKVLVEDLLTD